MRFLGSKYARNAFASEAPAGELTAPQTPQLDLRGPTSKGSGGEGRDGREGGGKGRGGRGKGRGGKGREEGEGRGEGGLTPLLFSEIFHFKVSNRLSTTSTGFY